ncbi:MAG: hypothetical protein PHO76_00250 [Methylotenera sp.]|nr:hypothetical protein [Methylotenera sp.]MDD4925332.1 hypothetical protein [Methylotenera sp.]
MKKNFSEFKIYSFYFILFFTPFIYAIQVVLNTYLVSYLIYISMIVLFASQVFPAIVRKNFCSQVNSFFVNSANSEKIAFSLAIYIALNGLNDIYYLHSYIGFLKVLTFFCLPILLFTVFAKKVNIKIILLIMTISGLLVGLETLWEFFNARPTFFEQLNFKYVKNLSGRELYQLLGGGRPTGLIEHLHTTQIFLVITFLCATIGFLQLKAKATRLFCLCASILVLMAVIANGTRLILVGAIIAWIVLYLLNTELRNKLYVQFLIGILSIICLYSFSSQNQYFWHVSYFQYPIKMLAFIYPSEYTNSILEWTSEIVTTNDSLLYLFGEEAVNVFDLPHIYRNLTFLNILFGLGFGSTSFYLGASTDDFYIAQFFAQLGILGSSLLISLLLHSWKSVFLCLNDINSPFKKEALILLCFLILFPFFVIHSGNLLRKSCWILFCLMMLISVKIDKYIKVSK